MKSKLKEKLEAIVINWGDSHTDKKAIKITVDSLLSLIDNTVEKEREDFDTSFWAYYYTKCSRHTDGESYLDESEIEKIFKKIMKQQRLRYKEMREGKE